MADQVHPHRVSADTFRNGLHAGAGALTGSRKSPPPVLDAPATSAAEDWTNEGGSLGPATDEEASRSAPGSSARPGREARDTVAGCRDRAAKDRLQAASAGTENSRRVFERSAASWELRGDDIQEGEDASAQQRAADRDLWASEERDDASAPDDAASKP